MQSTQTNDRILLWGSSALFACAVGVHTHVLLATGDRPEEPAKALMLSALAALGALVAALPLGALLQALPRKYGAGGRVVAWLAVGLAVGLLFVSEQALVSALGDGDLVGFVTTSWLWRQLGWRGLVLYVVTLVLDVIIMIVVAIMQGIAVFVVPPVTGMCCGAGWVLVALPFLIRGARKRSAPAL